MRHFSPILLLCLLAAVSVSAAPPNDTLEGWFHVTWGDPIAPGLPPVERYLLVDDQQRWTELDLDESVARGVGGALALNRQRIVVSGERTLRIMPRLQVRTLRRVQAPSALGAAAAAPEAVSKRYVTILCRFADSVQVTPAPKSTYESYVGAAYPGMDHYWREVSDGRIGMTGNVVVGWYNLPQPHAYYMRDTINANLQRITEDCTAAADADVHFPDYDGVIMQLNTRIGRYSWGGSTTLARDGVTRQYGAVWNASWAKQSVYAHEIGHSLGLPHSSGPYNEIYDSPWDVMSNSYIHFDQGRGTHVGQHTIAFHKEILGSIPSERRFVPAPATRTRITLERSAQPAASSDYLMVQIPLDATSTRFYTAESRRRTGYDTPLLGEAVIIHSVDRARRGGSPAQVVDADNNGKVNDAGAMWTPGEVFRDSLNGVAVSVESATQSGYTLSVRRGWELGVVVTGRGAVASSTGAISCTASCETLFAAPGAAVTLTATPAGGWTFAGWAGACAGTGSCAVTLTADRAVIAQFTQPLAMVSDSVRVSGLMGAAYSDTLRITGGTGSTAWALTGGALPAGVALDASTGVVSGVPTEAGTFRYTVAATSGGLLASRSFVTHVTKPALQPEAVLDQLLGAGSLTPDQIRFLDLLGNRNGRLDIGDVRAWLLDNKHINVSRVPGLAQLLKESKP